MKRKIRRIIVNVTTFFMVLLGTISLFCFSTKIYVTTYKLLVLSDNADFYNKQVIKKTSEDVEWQRIQQEREKLYNSEDEVIRNFSNQNNFVQVTILIIISTLIVLVVYMWYHRYLKRLVHN